MNGRKIYIYNARKFINVEGNVWEDVKATKETKIDGIWNNDDKPVEGIKVTIEADRDIYSDITYSQFDYTDSNGKFGFYIPMGTTYSVWFVYNGYMYQHTYYGNPQQINSISLEKEGDRNDFNNKFATIDSSNSIGGVSISNEDNFREAKYLGDSNLFAINAYCTRTFGKNESELDASGLIQDNLNLGITLREIADLSIKKDLYKVNVAINGKDQDYIYNKKNLTSNEQGNDYWDIEIKASDFNYPDYYDTALMSADKRADDTLYEETYLREIEPSDYNAVTNIDITNKLAVQVTYVIRVRNQSGAINVNVNEIVDHFDSDYSFVGAYLPGDDGKPDYNKSINVSDTSNSKYDLETYVENKGSESKYNKKFLQLNKNLTPGEDVYLFVVFNVNTHDNGYIQMDTDEKDRKGNLVEITGYSTTYASNAKSPNGNEYGPGDVAGRIDVDSNPGNATEEPDFTPGGNGKEDDADRAPYFRLIFSDYARIAQGTVWEDKRLVEVEKTVVGDGIRQDNETLLGDVEVSLQEVLADGTSRQAKIWTGTDTTGDENNWVDAIFTTSASDIQNILGYAKGYGTSVDVGRYCFASYIPGNYYIQFKYLDGQNYKSTKFNYAQVCEGFDYNNPDILGTYTETSELYSDARDLWASDVNGNTEGTRTHVNNLLAGEQTNGKLTEYKELYNENPADSKIAIRAVTGLINVNVTKTYGDDTSEGSKTLVRKDVTENGTGVQYELNNIDFGIVQRPRAQLLMTKEVTNVKVILQNGATFFDVGPNGASDVIWIQKTPHARQYYAYDGSDEDSKKLLINQPILRPSLETILLTMDEELMDGAEIQITYNIKMDNIGEVDYASKKYYYLTERDGSENAVETKVDKIVDYVGYSTEDKTRNTLKYEKQYNDGLNSKNWEIVMSYDNSLFGTNRYIDSSLYENVNKYDTILTYDIDTSLAPEISDSPTEKSTSVSLVLSTGLSGAEKETAYTNMAEILTLENGVSRKMEYSTVGNQDPTEPPSEADTDVSQTVTLTPPYGEKIKYTHWR